MCGTNIRHYVTTPNTTRLDVTIRDESLSYSDIRDAFVYTAQFVAKTLQLIDEGQDIVFRNYSS